MEVPSRRSDHSCDQCRKGKRRCDAPTLGKDRPDSCSNCRKYRKDCTFQWLSSRKHSRQQHRKRVARATKLSPFEGVETPAASEQSKCSDQNTSFDKLCPEDELGKADLPDLDFQFGLCSEANTSNFHEELSSIVDSSQHAKDWHFSPEEAHVKIAGDNGILQALLGDTLPASTGEAIDDFVGIEQNPPKQGNFDEYPTPAYDPATQSTRWQSLCALSNQTARDYSRSMTTRNLIRIYHDSIENALSCWLNERNCPYSRTSPVGRSKTSQNEWGPVFSNRICTRVCRLDYSMTFITGRSLSAAEDKTASRVLHKSIMAFASQWAQHFQESSDQLPMSPLIENERSFREYLWNDAKHELETSFGIPSFRIVFANILFSLTQRPLNNEEGIGIDELLEKDRAHTFLENAVRQMFKFRYQFAQVRLGNTGSSQSRETATKLLPVFNQPDSSLSDMENIDTFDLLFWLGVMFDTQFAAMYQRPPVVSDEDSQKASDSIRNLSPKVTAPDSFDLDGFSLASRQLGQKRRDLWGDFLLQKHSGYPSPNQGIPIWPFSHEEAAEVITDAAPVKVLLWRRITQLQTLIYREAEPELIEEAIQKALLVYRHWNKTYNNFILNCISNHESLPPRVQSWYVVLAAHWHLGAMLLADVIDNIDQGQLSSDHQRESRKTIEFACTLRMDNASAVATLARCSIYENESMKPHQFHDSLNDAAFLTEPFTVLLIHSFAKSGYIFLESLQLSTNSISLDPNGSASRLRQSCEVCIRALRYLGRKSDTASLVARGLSNKLNAWLQPESDSKFRNQSSGGLDYIAGIESYSWGSDSAFNFESFSNMSHDAWMYHTG